MKKRFKKLLKRGQQLQQFAAEKVSPPDEAPEDVRITNETVAARREEVLRGARKYIYPLQAPKHQIVKWSVGIVAVAVVIFMSYCTLGLYKFLDTSAFMYGVTQVVPFPVAIVNNRPVSYNDYLFELRHYMHYYETQQHTDFDTKEGKQQLAVFEQRSYDQVIQNAYVQELADKYDISVSESDVDKAVTQVRAQNRLGASDDVFQSVLSEFWGWSVTDFRRELKQELLAQKVVDRLDTKTHDRANQVLAQLQQGADFGDLAKQASDDQSTKANGGDYGALIDRTNTQIAPQIIDALFKLSAGQYSGIINTGDTLTIVKVTQVQGTQVRASDISFTFQPITTYTAPLQAAQPPRQLVHF